MPVLVYSSHSSIFSRKHVPNKFVFLFVFFVIIKDNFHCFKSLSARIFTVFGHSLLEDRVLHKEAWVAKLLGTHLSIQVHKKVKFSWRVHSTLALKGLSLTVTKSHVTITLRGEILAGI